MAFSGLVAFFLIRVFKLPSDSIPDRITKDWKFEKKSSDIFNPNSSSDTNGGSGGNFDASELNDEESPLLSSRLSHIGRSQLSNHTA
ncbi:putative organic anion transporter [Corchorus olitorius]|uniref:Organic anion transporter n=1 Tax=Corchorus olitorius TaxID=93759 RepID=A0A1R3GKG5_9ROSI|nr:putative organic anion transporter [Corchorus olitorius]